MERMHCVVLLACLATALCEVTQDEVNDYVKQLNKIEESTYTWQAPTDASNYTEGMRKDAECKQGGTYDFIIIGGGTAGTVLANRLTEIQDWSILVLEAGKPETKYTEVPAEVNYLTASDYNWGFNSVPLKHFGGFINHSVVFPSGKALGGSSVMNYLLYARGNEKDYNNWAGMGNPGWSYEEVLPYFKKSEKANFSDADPTYHGTRGPLSVEHVPYANEIAQCYLDAQVEMNRKILDYNGESQLGYSVAQVNEINGSRDSSARAFWEPIRNRPNLKVLLNTLVVKILINRKTKQAYGVSYIRNKECYVARVSKEVILSAGALSSPQLLMLSGIGPKYHLNEMQIPVVADLPVGNNLWDHIAYSAQSYSVNYKYPDNDAETNVRQYLNGNGVLTNPAGMQVVGFLNVENNPEEIENVLASGPPKPEPYAYYKNVFRYTQDTYNYIAKPQENITSYMVFCVVLYSKTRGTIRLKSKSPTAYPLINMPYFEDNDDDVETIQRCLRDSEKVAKTSAMQKLKTEIIKVSHPLCKDYAWGTDGFWKCMIRNLAQILHHYGGTCKMGPRCDPTAVVNTELKVHGVSGLRVVDAGVIPTAIAGHTMTIVDMVAEKAADMIKKEHGKQIEFL